MPFQEPWFSAQFVGKIWSWKHGQNRMFGRVPSPKTRHTCASKRSSTTNEHPLSTKNNLGQNWRFMYAVEKVFLSLPLFRYDQPMWKTSPRVMHDYKRSHGQHFQQSRPQNLSMEWRCFESSFVTGVCWCHTCKRRPSWKLFWIHRWDSETDRSSRSTSKNCL